MTLYSPVVFSDDEDVAADALTRGWHVVSHVNENVVRVTGNTVLCGLPQPRFSIAGGSLDAASTPVWRYVLNWLSRHLLNPMIVASPDHPLAELALWAAATRGTPFGALLTGDPDGDAKTAGFLAAAHGGYSPLGPTGLSGRVGLPELPADALVSIAPRQRVPERRIDDAVTRVLVVSHEAPTDARVEAWRALDGDETITVDVVTPARHGQWPPATHVVPDLGVANLSAEEDPSSPAAQRLFADEAADPTSPETAAGVYWAYALDSYFDARSDRFDVVVLVGEPAFGFAASAKRRWYARTVLEGLPPQPVSEDVAYRIRGWCFAADAVVAPPGGMVAPSAGGGQQVALLTDLGPEARRRLVGRLADHRIG